MCSLAFTAWMLLAAPMAAQTVEGQVVNSVTGAGIPGATVYLIRDETIAYTATTGSLGHFRMDGVKEGVYTWNCKAEGFMSPNFARSGAPEPVHVTAGGEPANLKIVVIPSCKVSGRVLDANGTPVPNAPVRIRLGTTGGWIQFQTKTNEKGEYSRTEQVLAGTLTVSAFPPPDWKAPEPRDGQEMGWAETFYGNAADLELATKAILTPGSEASNLDIKLRAVPVHHLRGMVLDQSGQPTAKAAVTMRGTALEVNSVKQETKGDGTFEFPGLVDGDWHVATSVMQDGVKLWAGDEVELHGQDVEKVELRLSAPFALTGKVIMISADGVAAGKKSGTVLLQYSGNHTGIAKLPGGPLFAEFGLLIADFSATPGDFTVKNVYPGSYMILASSAPGQYYLDSIKVGGRDATGTYVPIVSGALPLTATYKMDGGSVRGAVEACGSGDVVLVPLEPERRRSEFLPQGKCGANGRYEITAVRPGEYYAIALAKDDDVGMASDEFAQSLLNQSTRITVRPKESTSVDLRLSRR